MPIETAPKTEFIVGAWKDGKWEFCEMWYDDAVDMWTNTCSDTYVYPTHWTYLPDSVFIT